MLKQIENLHRKKNIAIEMVVLNMDKILFNHQEKIISIKIHPINSKQTFENGKKTPGAFRISIDSIFYSSRSGGNQISEVDSKPPSKSSREETAAQLAHAAAAHVNARQQVPPPPPVQQQQQQQYSYQQGGFPPQPHQVRGPAPRLPLPVNDPYQQRNFNQSNNNELLDNNEERRNRRSADKILDAFERFYMTKATTTPMKVKYIPEDNNSNHQRNTNNNNNNNYRDRSISRNSSTCN